MFAQEVSIIAAFFAGILSFLSPCVLPLVPAYISLMSGVSIEDLQQAADRRAVLKKTITASLAFIAGFSLVFILIGAAATAIGTFLFQWKFHLSKIGGIIIIILGLYFLGLFKKPLQFLNYEKRFHVKKIQVGVVGSFVVGLAFAFGWTPCYGPILGAIVGLASVQDSVGQGIFLLSVYSLGLGIPFLLTAIATQRFLDTFNKIKHYFRVIEIFSGSFLILIGVLLFTGQLSVLATKLLEWFPWLQRLG